MPRVSAGYSLYVADSQDRIMSDMQSKLTKGEKLTSRSVTNEIKRRWAVLPDSNREAWDHKASK